MKKSAKMSNPALVQWVSRPPGPELLRVSPHPSLGSECIFPSFSYSEKRVKCNKQKHFFKKPTQQPTLMPPWPKPHHEDTPGSGESRALQLDPGHPECN